MGGDCFQMPRFFVNEENIFSDYIMITGEDVKHIRNVLRLKAGEEIVLCNGKGIDYIAVIDRFGSNEIKASIRDVKQSCSEPTLEVVLFQGIPKANKMDFIIQKSVELGVKSIFPVITERTVVKFKSDRDIEKKVKRWQRISLEAAKQCNRGIIPSIELPITFENALELSKDTELKIIPYEKQTRYSIKRCISNSNVKKAAVYIGPEGGFEDAEIEKARLFNIEPVTLGPRILRTETAAVAVLSILMYEVGDIGDEKTNFRNC